MHMSGRHSRQAARPRCAISGNHGPPNESTRAAPVSGLLRSQLAAAPCASSHARTVSKSAWRAGAVPYDHRNASLIPATKVRGAPA